MRAKSREASVQQRVNHGERVCVQRGEREAE